LSSNMHSFWAEPNIRHIYIKCCARVWEGPRTPPFKFKLGLETGGPKAGLRLRPGGEYVI
jgi:hypothetical protein